MIKAIGGVVATVVLGGTLVTSCGSAKAPEPAPSQSAGGQFVVCSGAGNGTSGYAILDAPGPDCKPLVAGRDYADGRVIIGLKPGTTDGQLSPALAAYQATVISSEPSLGDKILSVPNGSVPQAVVGLARYPFITTATPDRIEHINQNT